MTAPEQAAEKSPELAKGLPSVPPWVKAPGRWTAAPAALRVSAALWWVQLVAFGVVPTLFPPDSAAAAVRGMGDPGGFPVAALVMDAAIALGIWMLVGASLWVRMVLSFWVGLVALGAFTSIGRESWPQIVCTVAAGILMWLPSSNALFQARWRRYLAYLLPDRQA